MDRRNFLRIAGGGVVLAATAGCSSALPADALAAWNGPAAGDADVRRWVLSYALLAPHSHNLQSWLVDLRTPGEILLFCDLQRLLPETDPRSRQILMSQGTFLELLDIARASAGSARRSRCFPRANSARTGPMHVPSRAFACIRTRPLRGTRCSPRSSAAAPTGRPMPCNSPPPAPCGPSRRRRRAKACVRASPVAAPKNWRGIAPSLPQPGASSW
nr:hypothetical protein [Ramlibacter montanisoli]